MATASRSTVEGTIGNSDATVTVGREATTHAVAAEYLHSTLNGTATCSSHSSSVYYETLLSFSHGKVLFQVT